MRSRPDSDLRLGQIAVRMGLVAPRDLPELLQEARSGHTLESAGRATSLGQVLLRRRLVSVSDYIYMARQARAEAEESQDEEPLGALELALDRYQSGELDADSFEELLSASGEPLSRPPDLTQTFGPYELLDEVARGGMGVVYRARDTRSGVVVALKVMIEADEDEVRLERFEREAELAAALDHPNIVRIHDAGRVEGMPYFTMDLVEGDSLDDLLEREEGLPRDLALRALAQTARAMDHAHARGIVHRDLKPGNILIERTTGVARVTDFGLARDLQRGTRLTQVGHAVGTPYYMAPEQVRGERDVDGRCDVYALGVILYEVLTGDVPFDADSPLSLFKKIDREEVVLPLDPARGIDERIHKVALRALAKDREDRYARAALLADDLERYLQGQEPRGLPYDWRDGLLRQVAGKRARLVVGALALGALATFAVVVAVGVDRLRTHHAHTGGHDAVSAALAHAERLRLGAEQALVSDPAKARALAEEGLARLSAAGELLSDRGARGAGARAAFEALEGERLRAALAGLVARAWLGAAEGELPADAVAALERAVLALPRDPALRLTLARALCREGRTRRALQALDGALELAPTDVEALTLRGELRLELGRAEPAVADLSDALLGRPDHVPALVLRSRAYQALERLDSAESDAHNARDLAPTDPAAHVACGDVARARGAPRVALACYAEALRLAPEEPTAELRQADLLASRGSLEEAVAAFERARARGGGLAASLGQARALARLFRLGDATRLLAADVAAAEEPAARAALLVELGETRLAQGETPSAREAFEQAAALDAAAGAAEREARVRLARLALDEGAGVAAARRLLGAIAAGEVETSALLTLRARLALEVGDRDAAQGLAERALASARAGADARPRRALAQARLVAGGEAAHVACEAAWQAAARGDELEAALLRQALELLPLAERRVGTIQREVEARLQTVLRLDPQRTRARYALARLQLSRGQVVEAWEELTRATREDPYRPEVAQTLARAASRLRRREAFEAALGATRRAIEAHGATVPRLLAQADCEVALAQWHAALRSLDHALRLAPDALELHRRRVTVLEALGHTTGAKLAQARVDELGEARDERRDELFAEARAVEQTDPQQALDLAREALRLGDPERHPDQATVARFVAGLVRQPEERLEAVLPTLLDRRWEALDRADAVLAPVWTRPLAREVRRHLLLRVRDGRPADALALAIAGFYDGLAGEAEVAWLDACLAEAERAVAGAPDAVAAHVARAYLRVHTGDAARGLRELLAIQEAALDSAVYQLVLAEAAAAQGQSELQAQALERAEGRLTRFEERLAASPFLR